MNNLTPCSADCLNSNCMRNTYVNGLEDESAVLIDFSWECEEGFVPDIYPDADFEGVQELNFHD